MCYSKSALPLWLAFSASIEAGEFINLGFDEPDLSGRLIPLAPGGPYIGNTSLLLPGWKITADTKVVTEGTYSLWNQGSGTTEFTLREAEPGSKYGNSLLLVSLTSNEGKPGPDLWLSQIGTIPKDAVGLTVIGDRSIEGYIDGVLIGAIDPTHGRIATWNVEAFQGKTVNLQIHSPASNVNRFDIYGFTTVPEPSEFAMLGLGLGVIGWQAWKRQRAHQHSPQNGGGRGSTHAPSTSADPV